MKNKFLKIILLSFFVLIANISFADDCSKCKIKDSTADVLNDYLDNIDSLINNLSQELASDYTPKTGGSKYISRVKRDIQKTLNLIIDWDGYYDRFYFYIIYGVKNEYVDEIRRDYFLLEKRSKLLNVYLNRIIKNGYADTVLNLNESGLCSGVDGCEFKGEKAFEIIGEIIKNHEKIKSYYSLSIMGKLGRFDPDLLFVEDNFKSEFKKYYNEYTTQNCSSCKGGYWDRLKEGVETIAAENLFGQDAMKSWQDAIAMLDGTLEDREYERIERELLEKELARNGVSTKSSKNILSNLEKFNTNGGYSLDNNFIVNSFDHIKQSVESEIVSFRDSIIKEFDDVSGEQVEVVSIEKFVGTDDQFKIVKELEEKVSMLYNLELPYAHLEDNANLNLRSRMIELHYNLTQAIKNLDSTIDTSRDVCNSQGQGITECE